MQAESALQAFAEVAVGIAGFSAVIIALRDTSEINEMRRWKWGLALAFCWSLGALFFSFLPFIVVYSTVAEPTTWRACLLSMGLFVGMAGAIFVAIDIRLNRLGVDLNGRQLGGNVPTSVTMFASRFLYTFVSAALLASSILLPGPGPYLAGLAVLLGMSLWTLLYFFFSDN